MYYMYIKENQFIYIPSSIRARESPVCTVIFYRKSAIKYLKQRYISCIYVLNTF